MNKIEEIKKKIRDLKLKQKMTTGRLEWNDIQREIDILNNELKQLETDKPQYGKLIILVQLRYKDIWRLCNTGWGYTGFATIYAA